MKNLKLMLTLSSLLSITALRADVDVVADAINDSDLETLRILVTVGTTHNHSFTVTKAQKEKYKELAQAQVLIKKDNCSKQPFSELDWLALAGFAAGTVAGAGLVYKSFISAKPEENLKQGFLGISGFCYGLSNTIRSVKDILKHVAEQRSKAKNALKKAEKVATLVDSMPVSK